MKKEHKISITVIAGILTLFFFPEPQTNFIYYILTILGFAGIIIWMSKNK